MFMIPLILNGIQYLMAVKRERGIKILQLVYLFNCLLQIFPFVFTIRSLVSLNCNRKQMYCLSRTCRF
jgi:hypothetical protein